MTRRSSKPPKVPSIRAVDLFCGVGGLTHGLLRGGIDVVAGVDIDRSCRYPYETNNRATFVEEDVKTLKAEKVRQLLGIEGLTLLAGCAPCQPFSTYSRSGRKNGAGRDWELVGAFGLLVQKVRPDFVTMENVPQVEQHSIFHEFISRLDGYHVTWKMLECSSIGVPQTRKRLVLLASRHGAIELRIPRAKTVKTVRDTIDDLPRLSAGQADEYDALHIACKLSDLNLKRIRASTPGGTWRDWKPSLRAACHRKETGGTYPSVYGRMEWDQPAPTITTQCFGYGHGRFGHPTQDRAITLREAAMLQTFPRKYAFVPKGERVIFNQLGRLIGNAVPVRLGEVIADSIVRHATVLE
jgi:DNA (cytosine-5)-methyltransferase 1